MEKLLLIIKTLVRAALHACCSDSLRPEFGAHIDTMAPSADSAFVGGLKMRRGVAPWVPSLVNPFARVNHSHREDARSFLSSSCRAELQRQFDGHHGYGDQRAQQYYPPQYAFAMRSSSAEADAALDQSAELSCVTEAAPFIDFLGVGVV